MSRPRVTLDPVAEKLTALGLDHPASCLAELVEEATRDELPPLAFLDLIGTRQLERKDERRVATRMAFESRRHSPPHQRSRASLATRPCTTSGRTH
jgi:hypothetical protein